VLTAWVPDGLDLSWRTPPLSGVSLSDVRVTTVIMHVLVVELLCQTVIGRVPLLDCLLPGVHWCLWLYLVLPGTKWHHYDIPTSVLFNQRLIHIHCLFEDVVKSPPQK
jgi:hypothetical protein